MAANILMKKYFNLGKKWNRNLQKENVLTLQLMFRTTETVPFQEDIIFN